MLFSGQPGAGKTTLIKKAVRRLSDRAGGFFVEESGRTLRLITLDGREAMLASRDLESPVRVGGWSVDAAVLAELGAPVVEAAIAAGRVVVLDEIEPLVLASEAMTAAIQKALDSESTVLGSIAEQAHPFLDGVRSRRDTLILSVTPTNRDRLLDRVWSGLRLPTESLADAQRAVQRQRERAKRYAADRRLALTGVTAEIRGDHGRYQVAWQNGQWHCSCSFFLKYGACAHSMTVAENLAPWLKQSTGAGEQPAP
ncbi:MAG: nucleoside-triphosphatase [Symbiobacteriia bacterium]